MLEPIDTALAVKEDQDRFNEMSESEEMSKKPNAFIENYDKTTKSLIKDSIQQKNGLDFVSWSHAWKMCKAEYPEAKYEIIKYDNKPYFRDDSGYYVTVRLFLTREDWKEGYFTEWDHALLDFRNRPLLDKATSQDVNKGLQRCLVKVIGIATGLGLSLWTGEDLPSEDINPNVKVKSSQSVTKVIGLVATDKHFEEINNLETVEQGRKYWQENKELYKSDSKFKLELDARTAYLKHRDEELPPY